MGKFDNKHVFISGGTRGIGFVTATKFLEQGGKVSIVGKSEEHLKLALNQLKNDRLFGIVGDFTFPENVERCLNEAVEKFGDIDILVNCVGIAIPSAFEDISVEEWYEVLAVNLTSFFLTSKFVAPSMKQKRYGKIINVSSIAGRTYSKLCGLHYSCSKAAIITMTKQLAAELGPYGINVNCICPGQTYTGMLEPFLKENGKKSIEDKIPLGYIAVPQQQANVIVFLATDEANYMNGAILDVNGGQL